MEFDTIDFTDNGIYRSNCESEPHDANEFREYPGNKYFTFIGAINLAEKDATGPPAAPAEADSIPERFVYHLTLFVCMIALCINGMFDTFGTLLPDFPVKPAADCLVDGVKLPSDYHKGGDALGDHDCNEESLSEASPLSVPTVTAIEMLSAASPLSVSTVTANEVLPTGFGEIQRPSVLGPELRWIPVEEPLPPPIHGAVTQAGHDPPRYSNLLSKISHPVLDGLATHDVCPTRSCFTTLDLKPIYVDTARGDTFAAGIGDVVMYVMDGRGDILTIELQGVLYMPDTDEFLISLSKFSAAGFTVDFGIDFKGGVVRNHGLAPGFEFELFINGCGQIARIAVCMTSGEPSYVSTAQPLPQPQVICRRRNIYSFPHAPKHVKGAWGADIFVDNVAHHNATTHACAYFEGYGMETTGCFRIKNYEETSPDYVDESYKPWDECVDGLLCGMSPSELGIDYHVAAIYMQLYKDDKDSFKRYLDENPDIDEYPDWVLDRQRYYAERPSASEVRAHQRRLPRLGGRLPALLRQAPQRTRLDCD
jgi:hypothetical protein